jgi:hypothetical protein
MKPRNFEMVIHTAYSYHRRTKTYTARAFAMDRGVKHSAMTGIGDTASEATSDAVRYVKELFERDGLQPPTDVIEHGKLSDVFVMNNMFGGQ